MLLSFNNGVIMITPKRPLYSLFRLFNCDGQARLCWALDQNLSWSAFPTILRPGTVYNEGNNWQWRIDLQLENFKRDVNNLTLCKQRHRSVVLTFIYSLRTLETWNPKKVQETALLFKNNLFSKCQLTIIDHQFSESLSILTSSTSIKITSVSLNLKSVLVG